MIQSHQEGPDESGNAENLPTMELVDVDGRVLRCTVEHTLDIEDQQYALLTPIDYPVEIFAWQDDADGDEGEAVIVEDEAELAQVLPIAEVVLAERNLILKRSGITLTVAGDVDSLLEEGEQAIADAEVAGNGQTNLPEAEDDVEELQLLASFYHEEREYSIYTPLDPIFIPVRLDDKGQPCLLSAEELQQIEPLLSSLLEDQLFDQW